MTGREPTYWNRFKAAQKQARKERTESAALVLLAMYAENECATNPADAVLFRELWGEDVRTVSPFTLHPYSHLRSYTVTRENE